jgi:hypothetical protein
MTNEEYGAAQRLIIAAGNMLSLVDIQAFIECADRALGSAAVFDPTLWIRGHERLQHVRDMAAAALKFRERVDALRTLVTTDGKTPIDARWGADV